MFPECIARPILGLSDGYHRAVGHPPPALPAGGFTGLRRDRIPQHADAGNLHLHHVPRRERADTRRGPGGDEVPRLESHRLRGVGDECREPECHVAGVSMLPFDAVHAAPDFEIGEARRAHGHHPWADRAERIEPLGPGPLRLAALQIARGHVVDAGDAGDGGQRLGCARAADPPAEHDPDFGFVLDPGGLRRQDDRVAVADHGGGRFEEEQRLLRDYIPKLRRVVVVIPPDADDLSGPRDGHVDRSLRSGEQMHSFSKSGDTPEAAP